MYAGNNPLLYDVANSLYILRFCMHMHVKHIYWQAGYQQVSYLARSQHLLPVCRPHTSTPTKLVHMQTHEYEMCMHLYIYTCTTYKHFHICLRFVCTKDYQNWVILFCCFTSHPYLNLKCSHIQSQSDMTKSCPRSFLFCPSLSYPFLSFILLSLLPSSFWNKFLPP